MFDIPFYSSSLPAPALTFLPTGCPGAESHLDIIILPGFGEEFESRKLRDGLSGKTDVLSLSRVLPRARVLTVQYNFKTLLSSTVDALATSFLDLLCGERQVAEPTRPILFVACALGRLIVSKAISQATRPEHECIRRAARKGVIDVEGAFKLVSKPRRRKQLLAVFNHEGAPTPALGLGRLHRGRSQTSLGLERIKTTHTWPVGAGRQINDFLKSLEELCDKFEIHMGAVSQPRANTLPASRKSARAGIDTLSNAIADHMSSDQGIVVNRFPDDSLNGHDHDARTVRKSVVEYIQRLATEVQQEATDSQEHGTITEPDSSSRRSRPSRPPSELPPLIPWKEENLDRIGSLLGKYSVSEEGNAFEQVQVTDGNWREIQRNLPTGLRFNIYFQNKVWVYTTGPNPDAEESLRETPVEIPLRIARAPVITMPCIKPFWHSGGESLPDPVKELADPKSLLDENLTNLIFDTYPFAQGFHLFFNGSLQLLVPKDFEKSHAQRMYPQIFAGFHVSFLSTVPIPTASGSVTNTTLSTQAPTVSTQPTSIATLPTQNWLQGGGRVLVRGNDGRNGPAGRIGVGLHFTKENKVVFTISSHIAFQSQEVRDSWKWLAVRQWRKWRNKPQSYSIEGLQVLDASTEKQIGTICRSFDSAMSEFPAGYEHDLAFVEPLSQVDISSIEAKGKKFYRAPGGLCEGRPLFLCSGPGINHEYGQNVSLTKEEFRAIIPAISIGQSCFKSRVKGKKVSSDAADAIHSRAILYRWFFRSAGRGTTTLAPFSGAALYAKPDPTYRDSETADMILGFQSFELVSERYDTDLKPMKDYKRNLIREVDGNICLGSEAVYGSMMAPRELIEGDGIEIM